MIIAFHTYLYLWKTQATHIVALLYGCNLASPVSDIDSVKAMSALTTPHTLAGLKLRCCSNMSWQHQQQSGRPLTIKQNACFTSMAHWRKTCRHQTLVLISWSWLLPNRHDRVEIVIWLVHSISHWTGVNQAVERANVLELKKCLDASTLHHWQPNLVYTRS